MSNYNYTQNIPRSDQSPATQRPSLETNTNSIYSIISEDHFGFGVDNGGEHKRVSFPDNYGSTTPTALDSELRTQPGTANVTASQLLYTNSSASFPVSLIRAFAVFPASASGTGVTLTNSYNIDSVDVNITSGTSTVNITSGAVDGTSYGVITGITPASSGSSTDQVVITYTVVSDTQFTVKTVNPGTNSSVGVNFVTVAVLQF